MKKIPLRRCIGCYKMLPKSELVRVVCPKEGEITLDETGKLPGRGAYICNNAECFEKARKNRQIERAFRRKTEDGVYDAVERRIRSADDE